MFGVLDRALDLVGLITLVYWAVKVGSWYARKRAGAKG
jgi:hypothetical protein